MHICHVERSRDIPSCQPKLAQRDSPASLEMTKASEKIIVALDVNTKKEALGLANELRGQVGFFKIGLQLYTSAGPDVVRAIAETGAKIFLDLKLHDIPNTVAKTVEAVGRLGVQMLSFHLSGGEKMVRAAVEARTNDLMLLGVTVLTSADQQTLIETGVSGTPEDQVLRLASLGVNAGANGLITSAREIQSLRKAFGETVTIVVPGIRPSWAEPGDQKRVMSPRQALEAGADYLVIGRPVTGHQNPCEAIKKIAAELGT